MVVERVVMLFVVMLGSKNIKGDAVCSHGYRAHMTGFVRMFHSLFHKGLYLSSFSYEISGIWLLVIGVFGCMKAYVFGSSIDVMESGTGMDLKVGSYGL